jgi:hypothetical protein
MTKPWRWQAEQRRPPPGWSPPCVSFAPADAACLRHSPGWFGLDYSACWHWFQGEGIERIWSLHVALCAGGCMPAVRVGLADCLHTGHWEATGAGGGGDRTASWLLHASPLRPAMHACGTVRVGLGWITCIPGRFQGRRDRAAVCRLPRVAPCAGDALRCGAVQADLAGLPTAPVSQRRIEPRVCRLHDARLLRKAALRQHSAVIKPLIGTRNVLTGKERAAAWSAPL